MNAAAMNFSVFPFNFHQLKKKVPEFGDYVKSHQVQDPIYSKIFFPDQFAEIGELVMKGRF